MKTQANLKRLVALALSIVMLLTLAPITAFAENDGEGDLTEPLITIASLDALGETTVLWQGFDAGAAQLSDIILPSELTGEDSRGNPLTISGVTWNSDNFNPDSARYYQFNPTLPSIYIPAQDVSLPVITVVIGALGGGGAQPLAAGDIIWDSSTPPDLTADDNDKTVLVKPGASGNLFIHDGVDSLTIKGPGLGTPITGMISISIGTDNYATHITLTIEDLNITAPAHRNAVDAGRSSTMTLHLKNVSLNGGPSTSNNGGNGISSAHGNIIIHAEEDVSLAGAGSSAVGLFGGAGIGAGYGKITIYGDLTAVGAKGIQAFANQLYIHGNVTAIGDSTIASSGQYYGVESNGDVFIASGASLTAKGSYGVGMGRDTTLDLAGSLNAEAEGMDGKTALLVPSGSQVMFSHPAATMTVKGVVSGVASPIPVAIDPALDAYTLCSFGGVSLSGTPIDTATSSTTAGTVYLDNKTDQTVLLWNGINSIANPQGYNVATSNGVDIDLSSGGLHENITTIIVTDMAEGTLIIPNGKTDLTLRGSDTTPDIKTEITNAQIRGENGTTNLNLTLQDLKITSPDIYYALYHGNTSDYKMTVNCENVTLIGADNTSGRPAVRAESPMIINGDLEAIGGYGNSHQGGNGIEASELTINGNVSATGGAVANAFYGDGKGIAFTSSVDTLTVNPGAVLIATGYSGIEQTPGSTVNLGGSIYAEATRGTAFFGGKVNFTDPAALLSVTDILSDPANNKIAIVMDLSGYSFYSTGAVTLPSQTQAESSTTVGTIFLGPDNSGGNVLVWDGDNGGMAATNGTTVIDLGGTHFNIDTIIAAPTATGLLKIPADSKTDITIQGMTPGAQVEVASGSVSVESTAARNSLTIKDLALKAPANQDAISINNNLSIMDFNNVLLAGGDSSNNVGGSGIYSHGHGDLEIYGNLEATGGNNSSSSGHRGGHGILAGGNMSINADIKAIGGNSVNESGGDGIHSNKAITLTGGIEAVGGNSDSTVGGNGIYASDEIDISGAINATGGNSAIGISTGGTLTIESSGDVKATGGDSTRSSLPGGNGITIANSKDLILEANVYLLATGGSGSGSKPDGFGVAVAGDINIGAGAIMEAIGAPGISMHASDGNIHLSGELYAESTSNTTALHNGKVVFENTDALLTVKDKVNDDRVGLGQIIISKGVAVNDLGHVFYATGGVELRDNNPIALAVSSTTLGAVQVVALPDLYFTAPIFTAEEEGYAQPAAQIINISNSGGDALNVNVASSSTNFEIIPGNTTIVTGSDSSWKIRPIAGLAAGTYTADITLFAYGVADIIKTVTFVVDAATAPSQLLTVNIASFASVQTGYTQPAPAAIILTNTGSTTLTNVSVSVSNSNFILNTGTATIASGTTDTSWTIRPITGLAAGTYTAAVTLSARGVANITKQVQFVVTPSSNSNNNNNDSDSGSDNDSTANDSSNTVSDSSISPKTADAQRGSGDDVVITLSERGNTLNSVNNGNNQLEKGKDYEVNGNKVTLKSAYLDTLSVGNHTFTFDMNRGYDPRFTLTITAGEVAVQPIEPASPATLSETWANPFADVNTSNWFYSDVEFVYKNGLFSGLSANAFGPDMPMTRGMVVTVLGRLAGINSDDYSGASFSDVDREKYYAPFITWAAESGIVSGRGDNSFAPDANISRQDLAVILNRYAEIMELDLKQTRQNVMFMDSESISDYAGGAVGNMARAGVVSGSEDGNFNPLVSATRAEVAAMLHRFIVAAAK